MHAWQLSVNLLFGLANCAQILLAISILACIYMHSRSFKP